MEFLYNYFRNYQYKKRIKKCEKLKEISIHQFKDLLNNEKKEFVLLGRPNCIYCRKYLPKIISSLEKNNISAYYLNVEEIPVEEGKEMFDKIKIEWLPSLIWIRSKNKVEILNTYSSSSAISLWLKGTLQLK
ncbi:hypothetical protein [Ligilactobacillus salivarius]|nr:hypothetical protein [Ligilactobacillus salivarius]QXL49499.1 hypothetical protein IGB11_00245 [Ligilactobacillus salivarius]